MSAVTTIAWTDRTWNPVRGCSRVSEGCRHCYAERVAYRFSGLGQPYEGLAKAVNGHAAWTGEVRYIPEEAATPLRWRKPARVFVNSMSDLFHEGVTDDQLVGLFAVMANARQHTFQVLTKRPTRMRDFLTRLRWQAGLAMADIHGYRTMLALMPYLEGREHWVALPSAAGDSPRQLPGFVPSNIWLGVSVEDQATADARIPVLLETPAALRFISAEPLLGLIDLEAVPLPSPGAAIYGLRGVAQPLTEKDAEPDDWKYWTRRQSKLGWVIVGGESGPGARPCQVAWVEAIVRECQAAAVPVFVKQLGAVPLVPPGRLRHWEWGGQIRSDRDAKFSAVDPARTYCEHWRVHLDDPKGADPTEWPEHLRVQQFPEVRDAR